MAFELLNELQTLMQEDKSKKQQEFLLVERVDKLLGHLHAMLANKENPLEDVDVEELSTQLAGLQLLGKKDHRDAMDDFSKLDQAGVSKNFYKFLDQIDDPRQTPDFNDKRSADDLLKYIATTHAPSVVSDWKNAIEAAQNGDVKSLAKIKDAVNKMYTFYQAQFNKLHSHFKVGGSFDDLVPGAVPGASTTGPVPGTVPMDAMKQAA
jgi:hypothetical protein